MAHRRLGVETGNVFPLGKTCRPLGLRGWGRLGFEPARRAPPAIIVDYSLKKALGLPGARSADLLFKVCGSSSFQVCTPSAASWRDPTVIYVAVVMACKALRKAADLEKQVCATRSLHEDRANAHHQRAKGRWRGD